jgi:hypothetical protein
MSTAYEYTWKNGIVITSKHQLRFPQPLGVGMIFVDLLTGNAHRVHSLYKAKENDRDNAEMPEDVVQTFPVQVLTEEQLVALRKKYNFEVDESLAPDAQFAILES